MLKKSNETKSGKNLEKVLHVQTGTFVTFMRNPPTYQWGNEVRVDLMLRPKHANN